jgi:hypothetical protein
MGAGRFCGCDHCNRVRREQDARERRMVANRARVGYERQLSRLYRDGTARERVALRRRYPGVDFSAFN